MRKYFWYAAIQSLRQIALRRARDPACPRKPACAGGLPAHPSRARSRLRRSTVGATDCADRRCRRAPAESDSPLRTIVDADCGFHSGGTPPARREAEITGPGSSRSGAEHTASRLTRLYRARRPRCIGRELRFRRVGTTDRPARQHGAHADQQERRGSPRQTLPWPRRGLRHSRACARRARSRPRRLHGRQLRVEFPMVRLHCVRQSLLQRRLRASGRTGKRQGDRGPPPRARRKARRPAASRSSRSVM